MKKNREQIIESMCAAWRPDYHHVVKHRTHAHEGGMTEVERSILYNQMARLFDDKIAPYMEFKH